MTLRGNRRDVAAFVLHDLEWLYATDDRLWRFLIGSRDIGSPCLIVARKVALPTRALLKQPQSRALEYFATLVPDHQLEIATHTARELRWSHTLSASRLANHAVALHTRKARAALAGVSLTPVVKKALEIAGELGLGTDPEHTRRRVAIETRSACSPCASLEKHCIPRALLSHAGCPVTCRARRYYDAASSRRLANRSIARSSVSCFLQNANRIIDLPRSAPA